MTTAYVTQISLIIAAEHRAAANRIAEAMGQGEGCYSIPLSQDGEFPATHWGLSTVAQQDFIDMITAARSGNPVDLPGIIAADLTAVMDGLEVAAAPVVLDVVTGTTDLPLQFDELAMSIGLSAIRSMEDV